MFGSALMPGVTVRQACSSVRHELTQKAWPHNYWGTFSSRHPHASLDRPAPTLTANWIGQQSAGLVDIEGTGMMRNFTPREGQRIQSMPDEFRWPLGIGITNKSRIIGNGWASRMGDVFADAFRAVDPESRTVIDLFCGGGLGAVGWHGRYWSFDEQPVSLSSDSTAMVGRGRE